MRAADFYILATDDILEKPLQDVTVAAGVYQDTLRLWFQDGTRRAFAVGPGAVKALTGPTGDQLAGAKISEVIGVLSEHGKPIDENAQILRLVTDRGHIDFHYALGEHGLQDFPE